MNMFNHKEWLIKDNIIMEDKKYFDKVFKGKLAYYIFSHFKDILEL